MPLSAKCKPNLSYSNLLLPMDQITIKTPNPKGRLFFLKIDLLRNLAAGVYLSEAPSPLRFLFGVVKQFCRFGIWSNTQCITPVDALHTTWSHPPVTQCINTYPTCTYSHRQGGRGVGGWTSENLGGALVHKRGRKYQHYWLYLKSINSLNTSNDNI